jgi:flagellar protein FliS
VLYTSRETQSGNNLPTPLFSLYEVLFMSKSATVVDNTPFIAETQAAAYMEANADQLTPYQVIQLLLDGALERLDQAAEQLRQGQEEMAGLLMGKAIGIINGLRQSLDFEQGGEMAVKLDLLYGYLIQRLEEAESETGGAVLAESSLMLLELKSGWDAITVAA